MRKGEIRCFVRLNSNVQQIKKLGYDLAYGDLGDLNSLKQGMSGCNILINIASIGFGHAPEIVKIVEEAGIRRAIFISTTALFTQLSVNSKSVRQHAEGCIRASNLDWTILRPTMIYGSLGDRNMIRLIRFLDRFSMIPISGTGNYLQRPVYVEDVAKSVVAVLFNKKTIKNEFNISGRFPHTYIMNLISVEDFHTLIMKSLI